jgi:hypothetical protein
MVMAVIAVIASRPTDDGEFYWNKKSAATAQIVL